MDRVKYIELKSKGDIDEIAYQYYKDKLKKGEKVYDKNFFLAALNIWAGLQNNFNVVQQAIDYYDNLFTIHELSLKGKPVAYY